MKISWKFRRRTYVLSCILFLAFFFVAYGKFANFGEPIFIDYSWHQTVYVVRQRPWPIIWKDGIFYTIQENNETGRLEETLLVAPVFFSPISRGKKFRYFVRPTGGVVRFAVENGKVLVDDNLKIGQGLMPYLLNIEFNSARRELNRNNMVDHAMREFLRNLKDDYQNLSKPRLTIEKATL